MKIVHLSQKVILSEEKLYLPLLSLFCFSVLIVRMVYTGTFEYRFMGINLILAWLPYIFAHYLVKIPKKKNTIGKMILFFLWLIFFPNAAYMITDIYHLSEFPSMPMWYDLIMLLSFAWCGLLLCFYSLKKMHTRFAFRKNPVVNIFILFSAFFVGGIGIYFGRYARWNSWEIVTQPANLYKDFIDIMSNTYNVLQMFSVAILFAAFLTIVYLKMFSFGIRTSHEDK